MASGGRCPAYKSRRFWSRWFRLRRGSARVGRALRRIYENIRSSRGRGKSSCHGRGLDRRALARFHCRRSLRRSAGKKERASDHNQQRRRDDPAYPPQIPEAVKQSVKLKAEAPGAREALSRFCSLQHADASRGIMLLGSGGATKREKGSDFSQLFQFADLARGKGMSAGGRNLQNAAEVPPVRSGEQRHQHRGAKVQLAADGGIEAGIIVRIFTANGVAFADTLAGQSGIRTDGNADFRSIAKTGAAITGLAWTKSQSGAAGTGDFGGAIHDEGESGIQIELVGFDLVQQVQGFGVSNWGHLQSATILGVGPLAISPLQVGCGAKLSAPLPDDTGTEAG